MSFLGILRMINQNFYSDGQNKAQREMRDYDVNAHIKLKISKDEQYKCL